MTSLVVGFMEFLKKFTTTELKRSLRAGKRLNACCIRIYGQPVLCPITRTYNLLEQLSKDSDELIVYQLTAFQARFFESFDLLLDNDLEGLGTNKQ